MGINWGGFASGISNGIQLGRQINELRNEDEVAKMRAQGIAEAKAMQVASKGSVVDQGEPAPAAPTAPVTAPDNPLAIDPTSASAALPSPAVEAPPMRIDMPQPAAGSPIPDANPYAGGATVAGGKRYKVGDAGFDTLDQANAHVAKNTMSFDDALQKTLVPKMRETYLKQGDIARADAWDQWAQQKDSQTKLKKWGQAFGAAQRGDYEKAADFLDGMHADLDDGHTILSREKATDKDGNVTGFNMTYKNDASGETRKQFVGKRELVEMGLSALNPEAMFKQAFARQTSADMLGAKDAIAERKDGRTYDRMLDLQDSRNTGAGERADSRNDSAEKRQRDHDKAVSERTARDIEARGAAKKQQIDQTYTLRAKEIASSPQYRKSVSPEEREAIIVTSLSKDPLFKMATPDEKKKQVADMMQLIPKPAAKSAPASPAAAPAAPAGKRAVTVFNPSTGGMDTVYR